MPGWRVLEYSPTRLCELIAEWSRDTSEAFSASVHAEYFEGYFEEIKAKTIVVEDEYFDRDYLEDYAAYYVRCFEEYRRTCRRLHFFDRPFATSDLEAALEGDSELRDRLQGSYVGFVVVRPIPGYAIGRTCLKTYAKNASDGVRNFPITLRCKANLHGIDLAVDSLAFQQQDRVVAACATAALWSAFHGTGVLFQHHIPSPIEITRSATAHSADEMRTIPNSGLTTAQMADAIRGCGLEPVMLRTTDAGVLKGATRAYLLGGIPVLMVGGVYETAAPTKEIAVHAVAITGFSSGLDAPAADTLALEASRITKLYVHDDGVGPFARMEFVTAPGEGGAVLTTSAAPSSDGIGTHQFCPDLLLVPVYHKIRVAYPTMLATLTRFEALLSWLRGEEAGIPGFTWDIRLTTVNDYKRECIDDAALGRGRREVLEAAMPRFIWLVRGTTADLGRLDLLFDATGVDTVDGCFRCVTYGTDIVEWFKALSHSVLDDGQKFQCGSIVKAIIATSAGA